MNVLVKENKGVIPTCTNEHLNTQRYTAARTFHDVFILGVAGVGEGCDEAADESAEYGSDVSLAEHANTALLHCEQPLQACCGEGGEVSYASENESNVKYFFFSHL